MRKREATTKQLRRTKERARRIAKAVLIVCSAAKTELLYFQALKQELGSRKDIAITVKTCGGKSPKNTISYAETLRANLEPDVCWCVFDRDEFADDFDRAVDQAKRNKIEVAYSIPCFEIWCLLHFDQCRAPVSCYEDVVKPLRTHIPGYRKNKCVFEQLWPLTETALANAESLTEHVERLGLQGGSYAATRVPLLVRELLSSE